MFSRLAQVVQGINSLGTASLMHGAIPVGVELVTVVALFYAVGRRWRTAWFGVAIGVGLLTGIGAHRYYGTLGLASEPPPWQMWLWVALSGVAVVVVVAGWRTASWWRRNVSVFAASFCLLATGLTINGWLGYFPTVNSAWGQLTNARLPDQSDWPAVQAMRRNNTAPQRGAVVPVQKHSTTSGFPHRTEWVYLPPAWFTGGPAAPLPALLMIGGEFGTPLDWIRAGDAVTTLDAFAAQHGGRAPVTVFADATGGFTVDTECVNGPHGNAADHLTADVIADVDTSLNPQKPTRWGVAGFSSGGTCAVDLTVMHPDIFRAFLDIGGDAAPNAGTRAQTIDRLFGGDAQAWASFDPASVIRRHGRYSDVAGLFANPGPVGQAAGASLCELGAAHGIECKLVALPGKHDWPSAASAFVTGLPWLAGRLHTPGVPEVAMP